MASDWLKVGAGAVAGIAVAKVITRAAENAAAAQDAAEKALEQEVLGADSFNGKPMGALAAQVMREMQEDAFRKENGPPKKNYTRADVQAVFDPPVTAYANALRKLTPELSAKVDAIAKAPNLEAALALVRELPEVFQISETGKTDIFQLRLNRIDPDDTQQDMDMTYAATMALVADKGALHDNLRLQVLQHHSIRSGNMLSRGADHLSYDEPVMTDLISRTFSTNGLTGERLGKELKNTLTPEVLAQAVRQVMTEGRPLRLDARMYG